MQRCSGGGGGTDVWETWAGGEEGWPIRTTRPPLRREQQGEDARGDVWSMVHGTLHRASVCVHAAPAGDAAPGGGLPRREEGGPSRSSLKDKIKCNSGKSNV